MRTKYRLLFELIIMCCFLLILCSHSTHLGMMAQATSTSIAVTGDSQINQCETKSYTIRIQHNSGNSLTDLVITNEIDGLVGFSYVGGTTLIDVNGGAAFCTADPDIALGPKRLIWDIDTLCGTTFTLNDGETLNVTFDLETDCDAVSGSQDVTVDYQISGTPASDSTNFSIQVLPGGVIIKKTPSVIPQELGQEVTWTLTIENTGLGTIKNVVVTDVLGDGLAYVSSNPAGSNAGQITTWDASQILALASMNPGDIVTIDITAVVIAGTNLDNSADVRWGCDMVTDCYNTAVDGGTARASVQQAVKTPLLDYTPPDISFTYCEDQVDVNFAVSNIGDSTAHDVWILVDFASLTVSDVSVGSTYNTADKRFELTDPLSPSGSYDLSFRLNYSSWCGGGFPAGDLLWQPVYKDDSDSLFYPPIQLSTINTPASSPSLSVSKSGAPSVIRIGDQITYNIASSYAGPLSCGSGTTGAVTVVDTIPNGFTVQLPIPDGGVWVDSGDGTGGTVTWTYTPPASLSANLTLNVPDTVQCETYCNTIFTNSVEATVTDCCGCALSASSSQATAIECAEGVTSDKTSSSPTERCTDTHFTNTYNFSGGSGVVLSDLEFEEHAEFQQVYNGNLTIMLGAADVTGCVAVTDNTPGGSLLLDFSGCAATPLAGQTLTITYDLTATANTVAACSGNTFYSWSSLDMGPSGSGCLQDGVIHETTVASVQPPDMLLDIAGLGQIVHKCESQTITMNLAQISDTADPKDVRLVLSGLNYYVVNPAATICGGIAPVSCTPTIDGGGDYVWEFGDAFTGSGQNATLQLDVQKRCTGGGDLVATVYFDDNCNADATYDDTCSTSAAETPALLLSGDLLIEKTPETYYADTNTAQWEIFVTNRGNGTAYNVWVDDILGSGLQYEHGVNPVVVDDMTGVTITDARDHNGNPINGVTIAIASMAAGERRQITVIARQIDCNNLTNDVSASWGCLGVDCQTTVTDNSAVEIPSSLLIDTNVVDMPVDACSSPKGYITLRNAGQTAAYNLQTTVTLPPGLHHVPGSTRWRINSGSWNGPDVSYDPNPAISPLQWTSTEIPGLAVANPGDTIEIEHDIDVDCPFSGGDVAVSTQFESPCGQVSTSAESRSTVALREPDVRITKTRVDEPVDCGDLVEWTITVENLSGYTLPVIWVEDTLGAAYTYVSSVGDPPFTADNGTFDGTDQVTWELRNVNHNDTVNLTIRATLDNPPCSANLDNTVTAWWGCGAADGSSATKPGVDPPDDTLCLTAVGVSDTDTPTREPIIGFLDIEVNPLSVDSCNDNTQLTVTMENTGPTDAENVDLVITLPPGTTYNAGSSTVTCGGVTNPAADPAISGNQLIYYDVTDNAAGKANNLCDTVQAAGGNDTLVLVFSVRSNCFVTADMDFDLYYYDCCEDTQYSITASETMTALYPDLSITKAPVNSQVECSSNQAWSITVTNNGTGNAQVVRIEDTLGDWIDYVGSNPAATAMGGQVYGWEINNLAGGGSSQTFNITGQLNPDAPQADCTALLRQNNVRAVWGCGVAGDAVDGDPTTQAYDCTHTTWANAPAATLQMPDLLVTGITPAIVSNADGSFSGSITVQVQNQGDGNSVNDFTVEITDGKGWTGTGTYTGNVPPGGSVNVTINTAAWNPKCQPCALPYTFNVTNVDLGDAVCECNEGNNTFGPVTYATPIPDLVVSDIDFSNVSCTSDNCSGSVSVIVTNNGCAAATNFQVSLATDGCLNFSSQMVVFLAAGASTIVTFPINGSWSDCTVQNCQFTAAVDPTDVVCECDGTNNDRVETYSTTLPDLVVTDIDFSNISCAADNCSGSVSVTVQNRGFGSAVGFQVSLATDGCLSFGNQTVLVPLGAGASTTVIFPITPPWVNCADCTCQFTAAVDPTNVTCECDGTNNQRTENYSENLPDLRVDSVTPVVTCVGDGNLQGTVTVNVENIGCADANNVVVRLLSTCGVVFAEQTVNLPAGTNTNLAFNYTTNCTNCTCLFIAVIDPDNLICECSGANNAVASIPYTINVPDVVVQSDTLAATCSGDGQCTVAGTVTLVNNGCGLLFNASVPMRFTLYDNSGGSGNVLDQWTQTFSPAIIFPGGGTQAFAITPRTINTNLCGNSTNCQVSIRMEADYTGSICECSGANNARIANKTVNIPDLQVQSDTLGATCLSDGQVTVSGNVTLVNNGCGSNLTANVPMRFTLYSNTGCGGSVVNQWTQTFTGVNIASGGGTQVFAITPRNITTNLVSNSTNCQFSVRVEADYNNGVCECDDADNAYCANNKAVDIPDLRVGSDTLSVTPLSDGQVTIAGTVTLANDGCGSNLVANVPVRFTLYNNIGGSQIAQWTETFSGMNIPAGGGTQIFTITPQNVTANICTNSTNCQVSIRVEADYSGTICESNGTNNTLLSNKSIDVPDLTINSVTPSMTCVGDGNLQGTVTVNVSNIGCGDANGAVVRLTSDCGIVFVDQTVNLAAGSSTNVTFNYTPNCGACTCTFTAAVDPDTSLRECDGINNALTSAPHTMNVPDVRVQSDTLVVTCSSDGQCAVAGNVTLVNDGCGANLTANVPVRFTLYDNTGCSGNPLSQWTQTFTGVNLASGGGTQVFTITPQTIAADLCTNSTNCQVSIRVEADYTGSICECDGTNNTYCADSKSVDIPNLEVQSDTLGVSCTDDGQVTVSGTVTLGNNGCGSNLASDIPMRFTLFDNTGGSGNQLAQWTQSLTGVNIASGGGTQVFTLTPQTLIADLCANSTNCQVSIRVEPDYNHSICECDGTDHTYLTDKSISIPDLTVNSVAPSVTSGTVTVNVSNIGCDTASGAVVRLASDCGISFTDQTVDLAASSSQDIVFNFALSALPGSCTFTAIVDPDNAVCECSGINNAAAGAISRSYYYLPIILKNYTPPTPPPAAPDLVVERIIATSNAVTVTIRNQGNVAVTAADEFWVDLYINPSHVPGYNETWPYVATQGAAWGVTAPALPLAAGGVFTLTTGGDYYWPSKSNIIWPLAPATPIYAQVDSANVATSYGAVLENHEMTGGPYNNVSGRFTVQGAGAASPPAAAEGGPGKAISKTSLPPRP